MSGETPRQNELGSIDLSKHTHWLAGQLDEVETKLMSKIVDLGTSLDENTQTVKENTAEQIATRQRFSWLAVLIATTILTTIVGAVITASLTG